MNGINDERGKNLPLDRFNIPTTVQLLLFKQIHNEYHILLITHCVCNVMMFAYEYLSKKASKTGNYFEGLERHFMSGYSPSKNSKICRQVNERQRNTKQ